jgi:hypothetical protein
MSVQEELRPCWKTSTVRDVARQIQGQSTQTNLKF